MSSRIMNGDKSVVRVVAYVLILCFLLGACSSKTDTNEDNWTGHETVGDTANDSTGTASVITDGEKQNGTAPAGNTIPDDESDSKGSVLSTGPSEKPTGSSDATIPANGNDGISTTGPSTTPSDNTSTTTPESDENDMPDYGIELPDDNWD